ncbi:MAG: glycosyltransferase family 4 protein [Candidatus Aenigmatarchaeota archaeon]
MVRKNTLKVLHVFGGIRAYKMCKSLAENGFEVYALTLENPMPYIEYLKHKNIHLISRFTSLYEKIKGFRFSLFKLHFIFYPFFIPEVIKICKKNKIKLIHAHRHTGAIVTLLAKKFGKLDCKIIFDYHDPLEVENKNRDNLLIRIFHKIEKWICFNSNFIITQGEEHDKLLIKRWKIPKEKINHIYNSVDIKIFNPRKKSRYFLNKFGIKDKTVLFVGSIVPCFGIHNLVQAAKKVVEKVHKVKFLIRGVIRDKKYFEWIKNEIKKNKLEKNFIWLPYLSQDEMTKLIASCDIGIILHVKGYLITETAIPNKIFEYMASGIPVISNNLPNLTRFVKHNYSGLVCNTDNPKELAEALIKLLKDSNLRKKLGKGGRLLCEKKFNWKIESKKLIKIYLELLEQDYIKK